MFAMLQYFAQQCIKCSGLQVTLHYSVLRAKQGSYIHNSQSQQKYSSYVNKHYTLRKGIKSCTVLYLRRTYLSQKITNNEYFNLKAVARLQTRAVASGGAGGSSRPPPHDRLLPPHELFTKYQLKGSFHTMIKIIK